MRDHLYQSVMGWWLVLTLVLITAIDVTAMTFGRPDDTVSKWFYDLGKSHPWVYLLVGITLGHILLPLLVKNGNGH